MCILYQKCGDCVDFASKTFTFYVKCDIIELIIYKKKKKKIMCEGLVCGIAAAPIDFPFEAPQVLLPLWICGMWYWVVLGEQQSRRRRICVPLLLTKWVGCGRVLDYLLRRFENKSSFRIRKLGRRKLVILPVL